MTINLAQISADRTAIIADLPTTISINSSNYLCRKSTLKRGQKFEMFGVDSSYDFTVHLNAGDVTVALGDKVTIDSTTYRVIDFEQGPAGVGLALHLGREFA